MNLTKILIFGGTTEGRAVSEYLAKAGIFHTVCVATGYGEYVLEKSPFVSIHRGRMGPEEIRQFVTAGGFFAIVDATHPYAELASKNVKEALKDLPVSYMRLLRRTDERSDYEKLRFFEDSASCRKALERISGNILLTVGSKELAAYCVKEEVRRRLYVRVLPSAESLAVCEKQGICGKQILALQGPFTAEMNEAMIRQYHIACLVTKKSGKAGGYEEKIKAAERAGIWVYVQERRDCGNKEEETGMSLEEVCRKLDEICEKEKEERVFARAQLPRIMIAAPKSGSGKTMIVCGLLQILKEQGEHPAAFKCGPDYIDPMFHREVIGVSSKNLDTFFTGENETRRLFLEDQDKAGIFVTEGVMGLYDGLGGTSFEGSSYHLAKVTKTPVLLVIDAKGMGNSLLALISGFLSYDTEHLIRGIILNRISEAYYSRLKPLIEEKCAVTVAGYLPEHKELRLESRHLGLKLPREQELAQRKKWLKETAKALSETVSISQIKQIAHTAEYLEAEQDFAQEECRKENPPLIAVARDEAFCFYYEENLRMLERCGAELIYFSPLHDREVPEECSGLLLGGGYPELYAAKLSQNHSMLASVRERMEDGLPTVAECGGFMYLHSSIRDRENHSYPMAGVLSGECYDSGSLVRFGYIIIEEKEHHFLPEGESIRGHEFHVFDTDAAGKGCTAVKPMYGKSYDCIISEENRFLGFPHLYYPSNPSFAERFVEKAEDYQKRRQSQDKITGKYQDEKQDNDCMKKNTIF